MKYWLLYWIMGCAIVGLAAGSMVKDCPHDPFPISEVTYAVSIWPAIFVAGIAAGPLPKKECKIAPT